MTVRICSLVILLLLTACESAYYDAMETIGIHKRDILISGIEDAQEAQEEGQGQRCQRDGQCR